VEIIGHHTCFKKGGETTVLKEAPFPSKTDKEIPFLGEGYYFWDDNLDMAKFWGSRFYKNDYFVVEGIITTSKDIFLDLVGNRQDMKLFRNLMNDFKSKGFNAENWSIGAFIEFLKQLSKYDAKIFPYKIIRAIDHSASLVKHLTFYFVQGKENFTNLAPRILICLVEKNSVFLRITKIVAQS